MKPKCWLYENKAGHHLLHYHANTPRFLADKAAAIDIPESHTFTALYDQAALDAAVAAERERCAKEFEELRSVLRITDYDASLWEKRARILGWTD